jgi:hypothetical protein
MTTTNFTGDILDWLKDHQSTTLPAWLKRNPHILEWITERTAEFHDLKNVMERVYIVLNGPPGMCEMGNKRKFNTFELGYRKGCILGNKCGCVATIRQQNQRATLLEKYGVDKVSEIPGIQDKQRQTNLKKYGVEWPAQQEHARLAAKEFPVAPMLPST